MTILSDTCIRKLIESDQNFVRPFYNPGQPYDKESKIQPASLDLSLGKIYLPDAKKNEVGSIERGDIEHWLRPGETVVVSTLESLKMPSNVAGIGFPPARIARDGILMTNPGHIDPGFEGYLHFTIMNMGREKYRLKQKDIIFSIALFSFEKDSSSRSDYSNRGNYKSPEKPDQKYLDALSSTFFDFKNQAEKIFEEKFGRRDWWAVVLGFAGVLGALLVSNAAYIIYSLQQSDRIASLENQVQQLQDED